MLKTELYICSVHNIFDIKVASVFEEQYAPLFPEHHFSYPPIFGVVLLSGDRPVSVAFQARSL